MNNPQQHLYQFPILTVEEIRTFNDLRFYFKQRLGAAFDSVPAITLSREDFYDLTSGPTPLLTEAMEKLPTEDADDLLMCWYDDGLLFTFHIEKSNVGDEIVNYMRNNLKNALHAKIYKQIRETVINIQKLHYVWRAQPIQYYNIVMPYRKNIMLNSEDDVDPFLSARDLNNDEF